MKKRVEMECLDCDNYFTVKSETGDPVKFCPFCGAELSELDSNEYDDGDE